jgi:hypothetical protein
MKYIVTIDGESFECEGRIIFPDEFKIGDSVICSFTVRGETYEVKGGNRGDVIYGTASDKIIQWNTYRQWAHLTTQARRGN